jgi:glycosyltransferase involved in cell wall biosynthesis
LVYFKKKCIFAEKSQQMVKVSVILPIYNVAPYLDETFQSLLTQTLKEIEIIAVNDGSTDNSEDIVRKYAQQDSRIIIFNQKNKGQSAARNLALQHATGQYIYMMDSDDVLAVPNAFETCYEYAEKNNAELIFFDGDSFSEENANRVSWNTKRTHLVEENKKYDGKYLLDLMLDKSVHNCVVWLLFISMTNAAALPMPTTQSLIMTRRKSTPVQKGPSLEESIPTPGRSSLQTVAIRIANPKTPKRKQLPGSSKS